MAAIRPETGSWRGGLAKSGSNRRVPTLPSASPARGRRRPTKIAVDETRRSRLSQVGAFCARDLGEFVSEFTQSGDEIEWCDMRWNSQRNEKPSMD